MRILWKVRAWSKTREFFDRILVVTPDQLAPLDRHLIEYVVRECRDEKRTLVRLRHLFREIDALPNSTEGWADVHLAFVPDYFEGENGKETTVTQIMREKTGNPDVVAIPSHFRNHDIKLMFDANSTIPLDPHQHISLSQGELDCLAYFVRDGREIRGSRFMRDEGPRLSGTANVDFWALENHSEEVTRSFVTVFRRLYMDKEPGNFDKACALYADRFLNKRITNWVSAVRDEYNSHLRSNAMFMTTSNSFTFSVKRLLDVFIYSRYAHQPRFCLTDREAAGISA